MPILRWHNSSATKLPAHFYWCHMRPGTTHVLLSKLCKVAKWFSTWKCCARHVPEILAGGRSWLWLKSLLKSFKSIDFIDFPRKKWLFLFNIFPHWHCPHFACARVPHSKEPRAGCGFAPECETQKEPTAHQKRRRSLDIMLGTHEVSQLHTPKFLRWTGLIQSQLGETFRIFFCIFSKPSLRLLWLSCDELCTEFSPSLREFGCESNFDTSTTCTRPLQSQIFFEERIFETLGFIFSVKIG